MWKWIAGIFAAMMLVLAVVVVNAVWFKPFSLNVFYERTMIESALRSPQLLTQLGLLESYGIRGHNAELDDLSPEARAENFAHLKETYATFSEYDSEDIEGEELVSHAVFKNFLELQLAEEQWQWHDYPVNQLFGMQNSLPNFLVDMHQIKDETGAEHYVARLNAVPEQFVGLLEDLQGRAERGVVPPRFVLEASIEQIDNFLAGEATDNLLYTSLITRLENSDIPAAEHQEWLTATEQAITDSVEPAYTDLRDYLATLSETATNEAGVWKLPDGEAYYQHMLKRHTTTELTADEIHQLGLSEVERIQAEMRRIFADEGYTDGDVGAMLAAINADDDFLYDDSDAGRAQILADYNRILDDIETYLDPAFRMQPEAALEVRRVPEFAEKNAPGAYYQRPALDGSRPGVFYANLYNINDTPTFGMKTLAVHEGTPGHHFQLAIQQEVKGLPTFRSFMPYTVHSEGWALYTELLMYELGLYEDDPFGNLGRLQAELFRAVRLVVDTGIHAKRWTREEAIDYMVANTGMTESSVFSEIERYIVMPGQATSYKLGMLKFVELRAEAREQLGSNFDLRDFHDVVLQNGSVPLPILEQLINQYVADRLEVRVVLN